MDVPARPQKSDFLYTKFLPNIPLISMPFSIEKHPILNKLGVFYNNLPKNTPNLYNLGSFVSDENLLIVIPNFVKKRPKREAHIRISRQCKTPRANCLFALTCSVQGSVPSVSQIFNFFFQIYSWKHSCTLFRLKCLTLITLSSFNILSHRKSNSAKSSCTWIVNFTLTMRVKGIVSYSKIIFLLPESEDINKKSLFPKFHLIPILRFQVMHDYVCFIAPIDYSVE